MSRAAGIIAVKCLSIFGADLPPVILLFEAARDYETAKISEQRFKKRGQPDSPDVRRWAYLGGSGGDLATTTASGLGFI